MIYATAPQLTNTGIMIVAQNIGKPANDTVNFKNGGTKSIIPVNIAASFNFIFTVLFIDFNRKIFVPVHHIYAKTNKRIGKHRGIYR